MAREPCVGLVSVFADEVALVVKELGLEEGLPLAKAPCSQHEKTNKQTNRERNILQIFANLSFLFSDQILNEDRIDDTT